MSELSQLADALARNSGYAVTIGDDLVEASMEGDSGRLGLSFRRGERDEANMRNLDWCMRTTKERAVS